MNKTVLSLLAAISLLGCPSNTTRGTGTGGGAQAGAGGGSAGTGTAVRILGDAESAAVLTSVNAGEISVAEAVDDRLSAPEAQRFAAMMVTQHTDTQQQASALLGQENLNPQSTELSRALNAEAQAMITQLQGTSQVLVDRAYMQGQLDMHRATLLLIDCAIRPGTQNARLRDFVTTTVRPAVQMHHDLARTVVTQLALLDGGVLLDGGMANGDAELPATDTGEGGDAGLIVADAGVLPGCAEVCSAPAATGLPPGLRAAACR